MSDDISINQIPEVCCRPITPDYKYHLEFAISGPEFGGTTNYTKIKLFTPFEETNK